MEHHAHLYRLSQPLLDLHHKGMSARDAARELGSQLFSSATTGVDVLAMMFDDVVRSSLADHSSHGGREVSIDCMLAELVSRLIGRWQESGLVLNAPALFEAARQFIEARSAMIDAYRSNRRLPTLRSLNSDAMRCLDASDALYQRASYHSRAESNIRSMGSARLVELLYPAADEVSAIPPLLEAEDRALDPWSDAELGARIMRSLRNNRLATYDPSYPVDGVRSIYVLIPLLISYLNHPNRQREASMPAELAALEASLSDLASKMESINRRYERLSSLAVQA